MWTIYVCVYVCYGSWMRTVGNNCYLIWFNWNDAFSFSRYILYCARLTAFCLDDTSPGPIFYLISWVKYLKKTTLPLAEIHILIMVYLCRQRFILEIRALLGWHFILKRPLGVSSTFQQKVFVSLMKHKCGIHWSFLWNPTGDTHGPVWTQF